MGEPVSEPSDEVHQRVSVRLDCGHTQRADAGARVGSLRTCWWDRCMTERRVVSVRVEAGA